MEEDTEYKKLPVDERCVHKLWKARLDGYEELIKIFRGIDDEKAPEWNKYLGLVKKFVIDSHAMAQERGLEATLIYVENAGCAGKTVNDVMGGLVTKCFSAPKAKVKDLAFQIALMYIEIEKQDAAVDELVKGLDAKNPKIVAATIVVLTQALREFGNKVVGIKPFIKKIPVLLADRDKNVRDEAKQLTIEIFRWIGPALKPHIASIAAVLLTELETEFDKIKNEKPEPTRYLKSQQEKQSALKSAAAGDEEGDADDEDNNQREEVDPLDLIDPVDILSKLPKDFYDKLEAKKWQERKESLEALQKLLENPKLESGDYGDCVKALKKVLTKDTNVVLVAMAGKCLACLAKGLGKKFTPYALACVSGILEKFKEKKTNVVAALREAIDAIYPSTTLEAMQEDLLEALNNKNPSIKAETASFLARAVARTQPAVLNKKLIKAYSTALLKTLNESDPTVRDSSAEALGTLLKLLGEKAVGPHLVDVDALKMAKIKECSEKAEIFVKTAAAPKKERPTTAPVKASATATKAGSAEPKSVTRPASGAVARKAPAAKKPAASNAVQKSASSTKATLPSEREMTPEEVDEKATELLSGEILSGLVDSNWKNRLSTAETFVGSIDGIESKAGNSQVLARTLCKKPGLKETNFQVLKLKLDALAAITEKLGMTTTTAESFLTEIVALLADSKNSAGANQVLTAVAEAIQLEYVVSKVITIAFEQKSPKVQSEALNWVGGAIKEFGMQVNPKTLLDDVKKAVQSINPAVRQAAIQLVGIMHLYMGNTLAMFFDSEKPALKQQIQAEFDKNADQKPPKPTRGANKSSSSGSVNEEENDEDDQPEIKLSDMLPRIDISSQITEALIAEMSDKNWKTRNEGLTKLQGILNEAKLIKPSIGDLPQALGHRLVDSNAKIAQTSMSICQQLAEAMGPACKQHVRVLFPGFLNGLSDSKAVMRSTAIQCMNAWGEQCGYKEFFDGEMIAEALKTGNPSLRTELWGWLSEKLPTIPPKSIPKDEILASLPYLYASVCDRNADVRKNANEAVLGCMLHVGYEPMVKALEHQKPASKKTILASLDKARPSLPVKPLPKGKGLIAPIEESKPATKTVGGKTQKVPTPVNKPAASRKKDEDVDTSPLLSINNLKNQRMLDEQKLKVLKWTFTTPRDEFTDLLRDQMTTAGLNKNLLANMFHEDFRYHLKVIEALQEDLNSNQKALICNLDLILKWISLRFYDTNPSVLLKGLDYLNLVMQMLIASEYDMSETEGTSFLPHLLVKLGDPKDAVRNGVRSLFRQICLTYPFTKVFTCIMEGLKSKNARQRTECLDELGYLIETYGMGACQPSAQIALKEIAKHIADRDNSVRSAALNCVVQAYFIVDERVYRLIGQLSEKDLSMLDERIKRAKKTRKVPAEVPMKPVAVIKPDIVDDDEPMEEDEREPEPQESPQTQAVVQEPHEIQRTKPSGPFKLDQEFISDIERDWVRSDQWQIPKPLDVKTDFLHSPLKSADVNGVSYPAERLQRLISSAPHQQHMMSPVSHGINYNMNTTIAMQNTSPTAAQNLPDILPKLDPNLMRILRSVGSSDTITARAGLNELNDILESPEKQAALRDYEEIYIENVCLQLKNLSQIPVSDALAIYQPLLSSIYSFYTSRTLGKNVGIEPLKKFMALIIGLMVEQKLPNSEENEYTKVVNGICLKIFDKSNFTNIICALIRLLKETCSGAGLPKFTDLLMKCIWRNVKNLPEKSNEIDYDAILLEVHDFMVQLPSSYWHQRHADTPYRTVKTIIHHLAQIKGNNILQHLSKIPTHSELYSYLLKVLKNIQKDGHTNGGRTQTTPSKKNTVQSHEAVSAIFKLISDKETKQEGIQKLYEFKIKNPDVDIDHYLHGSNPIFRKFIDDGLAELERAAAENNQSDNKVLSENRFGVSKTIGKDPDYWMERLNALKKNARGAEQQSDNRSSTENLNVNLLAQKSLITQKETSENISANRLELMKQRLAQVRSQK